MSAHPKFAAACVYIALRVHVVHTTFFWWVVYLQAGMKRTLYLKVLKFKLGLTFLDTIIQLLNSVGLDHWFLFVLLFYA